jgi:hypothetical protein
MGGHSSGRYRTRNRGAIEQALRLDMRVLRRRGFLQPGAAATGPVEWTRGGERSGAITLCVDLTSLDDPHAVLTYSANDKPTVQRVQLAVAPCRFGGHRFYFFCPVLTWRRCTVLAYGAGRFASRQAQRLTYWSQSEDALDRLRRARDKAEARVFGKDGHPRPRGANRERLVQRWIELDAAWEGLFAATVRRRWGHLLDHRL